MRTITKKSQKEKERRIKVRETVIKKYGNKCACCGEKEIMFLCMGHAKGGLENKSANKREIYNKLLREKVSDNYRVLCGGCQKSRILYGYCPHEYPNEDFATSTKKWEK